jgi:hypothetical protein
MKNVKIPSEGKALPAGAAKAMNEGTRLRYALGSAGLPRGDKGAK